LAALGCDAGQGYAIQTPCPPAEIDFAGLQPSNEMVMTRLLANAKITSTHPRGGTDRR
jgi:hypothetical protein